MSDYEKMHLGYMPVVCDMSSNLLTRPVDWKIHDIVYASAQKNLGIAGLTVVIVRRDLISDETRKFPFTPTMCDWQLSSKNSSMYNTPPSFAIYMMGLVLEYIEDCGGINYVDEQTQLKAGQIYSFIENSQPFYQNPVSSAYRSRTSIPFLLANDELMEKFMMEAKYAGIVNLKGHKAVGGGRISLSNGISLQETQQLVDFMEKFRVANRSTT